MVPAECHNGGSKHEIFNRRLNYFFTYKIIKKHIDIVILLLLKFLLKRIAKHWPPERLSLYAILVAVLARVDTTKRGQHLNYFIPWAVGVDFPLHWPTLCCEGFQSSAFEWFALVVR